MFVYLCSIKIYALGFDKLSESTNSWKAFSASCCCESVFAAKSCWDTWRRGSKFTRSQANMVNEAKLPSPIHSNFFFHKEYALFSFQYSSVQFSSFNFWSVGCSMCSQALSWKRIRPFLLTNDSCRHCRVWCISSVFWAYFSDIMVLLGFRKL